MSFLLNRSENFLTEFVVLWELALSLGVIHSICRGEELLIEPNVLAVPGVGRLSGSGESSGLLKAFLLRAEDGVLSSRPNRDRFFSMRSLPSFELLSRRVFLWLKKRMSSTLVDVNKSGASVFASKGFEEKAGCCDGSGIGSSQSVANSACSLGVESLSGEVTFSAVMRSISELGQYAMLSMVAWENGLFGEGVHPSGVRRGAWTSSAFVELSSCCPGSIAFLASSTRSGLSPFRISKALSASK